MARPDLAADRARAFALVPVSRETTARLDRFTALLLDWQSRINLIAASTVPVLWTRHIADSLQLLAIAPDARKWVDLGSGGGFPGVPIACALAEQGSAEVHLIESNKKKAAFLREAVRITGAPAIVHAVRIADFCQSFRGALDAVTARALAPLPELLSIAYPLLKKGPQGVFPKGQDVEAELTEAAKCWSIQASLVPSRTDPESRVVLIRRAEPTRKQ
ncbi:MAG TPA: 16S rRNA (guanine(527)-N(7))-methyltransferase RsmG [Xanthobacteraceae bacterium]|nr:16S rRNA (guanine(527)-N(7))-methyltransferase RsmG [Xanthobacteraceae bacterium]HYQ05555.1 16S rRNA (guanine(527)-N(7))-methyltransferase RsmG [Xanthobacteraceae bacterium]